MVSGKRAKGHLVLVELRLALAALTVFSGLQLPAAGTYKWVDEKGVTHYGDRIPPEYANQGAAKLNKKGMVVKKINPAPTTSEIRNKKEEEQKLREALREAEDQKRKDLALLDTFASEQEIDQMRDRNLNQVDALIRQAERRITELKAREAALERELEFYGPAAGKKRREPPAHLLEERIALKNQQAGMQAAIGKLVADKDKVRARFEDDKVRFREIKANGIASTRLSAVSKKVSGAKSVSLALDVNDPLVEQCIARWRPTLTAHDFAHAVSANIMVRAEREEVVLDARARNQFGQAIAKRWVCPLGPDRQIDARETEVRKALASIGASY